MIKRSILLLGSNMGDRLSHLSLAAEQLKNLGTIAGMSAVYETDPWGIEDQPAFLNQVVLLDTLLPPKKLLEMTQQIEQAGGRKRHEKWGPRTLDIDILFYGDEIVQTPELEIPHPAIAQRRFALVPLAEVAPDLIHPVLHVTLRDLLRACEDTGVVRVYTA